MTKKTGTDASLMISMGIPEKTNIPEDTLIIT
jgi:hypothetical protein